MTLYMKLTGVVNSQVLNGMLLIILTNSVLTMLLKMHCTGRHSMMKTKGSSIGYM